MKVEIPINEALYKQACLTAAKERRDASEQIEYWASIGKTALENPELPIHFIRDVLVAKQEVDSTSFMPRE